MSAKTLESVFQEMVAAKLHEFVDRNKAELARTIGQLLFEGASGTFPGGMVSPFSGMHQVAPADDDQAPAANQLPGNRDRRTLAARADHSGPSKSKRKAGNTAENNETILKLIGKDGASRAEIEKATGFKPGYLRSRLNRLVQQKVLVVKGKTFGARYFHP